MIIFGPFFAPNFETSVLRIFCVTRHWSFKPSRDWSQSDQICRYLTRLGAFWKFLATNLLTKVSQIFGDFLNFITKPAFKQKVLRLLFGQPFETFRLLIIPTSGHTCSDLVTPKTNTYHYLFAAQVKRCYLTTHVDLNI